MLSDVLGVALALSFGIMLASAGSASSMLGTTSTVEQHSVMKSSNMSSSSSIRAGNMSKQVTQQPEICQKQQAAL
ncbi:MAG TPA: hypothetical protein VFI73_03995 [Candidatus Nitrosopolaris sp.]|nr:hypothetical protein [Candidatus Nitrosopolaris sp.]